MQISNHKLLDLEVALGELQSTSSMFRVRRRLYDAMKSLVCFLRVLYRWFTIKVKSPQDE